MGVEHLCVWNIRNKPETYTITVRLPKNTGDDMRTRNIRAAENHWPAGQDLEGSRSMTTLATRITVICTEKTDRITYVLLVKIVTDEPINSPNFHR